MNLESLLIISLYPLNETGGGEYYTLNSALSAGCVNEHVDLFSPIEKFPDEHVNFGKLDRHQMVSVYMESREIEAQVITLSDLINRIPNYKTIWIHQYLSSSCVFEIIANTTSDQRILFTNLGHEAIRSLFAEYYQPQPRHFFAEISNASAAHFSAKISGSPNIVAPLAGIWKKHIGETERAQNARQGLNICSIGRVLPHKGFETVIQALPPACNLRIIGPTSDSSYHDYLKSLIHSPNVVLTGRLSGSDKRRILESSDVLVAASTTMLFDGRKIEQAELLGLVIIEAIACSVLPVTSDLPSFVEIMTILGLEDLIYPQRDASELNRLLARLNSMNLDQRQTRIKNAKSQLVKMFLWDDYWTRICSQIEALGT